MFWPAERRCLAVQTPNHEAQSDGQQRHADGTQTGSSVSTSPPPSTCCAQDQAGSMLEELQCVLRTAENTEPCRKVGEFTHRERGC